MNSLLLSFFFNIKNHKEILSKTQRKTPKKKKKAERYRNNKILLNKKNKKCIRIIVKVIRIYLRNKSKS